MPSDKLPEECRLNEPLEARRFRTRDFIVTKTGLAFALVVDGLRSGSVRGTLRYRREHHGWVKLSSEQALNELTRWHPHWLVHDPAFDAVVPTIPLPEVAQHLEPEARLQQLLSSPSGQEVSPADSLIAKLRDVIRDLVQAGVKEDCIGVTGSILLGAHQATSDLDLVIRTADQFALAQAALTHWITQGRWESLNAQQWQEAWQRRAPELDLETYRWHQARKQVNAIYQGTKLDLSLGTPTPELLPGKKVGLRRIQATITDDRHAFEMPSRWSCDHDSIKQLVTWTATYCGQVRKGETFEAQGMVEQVADGTLRMIIGSSREAQGSWLRVVPSRLVSNNK